MLLRIPLAAIRSQAAAASRKMRDSDLRLAQRIQQRLLTPPPEQIDGFELACSYTPAMMVGVAKVTRGFSMPPKGKEGGRMMRS